MIAFADPVTGAPSIAESQTGRDYLSWSAVSTYLKCPLKYQFHYLDQLPEEFVAANLVFGSAIHAALEAYFDELLASRRLLGVDALLAVYHATWNQADLENMQFGKSDDLASLSSLAERMLHVFVTSDLSRPTGSIIGIEEELRAPVIADCPDLLARLDLMVETDEALVVTDFKTARSRWSPGDVNAAEGQLIVYHELVRQFPSTAGLLARSHLCLMNPDTCPHRSQFSSTAPCTRWSCRAFCLIGQSSLMMTLSQEWTPGFARPSFEHVGSGSVVPIRLSSPAPQSNFEVK